MLMESHSGKSDVLVLLDYFDYTGVKVNSLPRDKKFEFYCGALFEDRRSVFDDKFCTDRTSTPDLHREVDSRVLWSHTRFDLVVHSDFCRFDYSVQAGEVEVESIPVVLWFSHAVTFARTVLSRASISGFGVNL